MKADEMDEQGLKNRTKSFALRALRLSEALPRTQAGKILGHQLLRAATSVAANYRAACRARSQASMIAKLDIVLEEVDESHFWIELIADAGLIAPRRVTNLSDEANQLTAIFVTSLKTLRARS